MNSWRIVNNEIVADKTSDSTLQCQLTFTDLPSTTFVDDSQNTSKKQQSHYNYDCGDELRWAHGKKACGLLFSWAIVWFLRKSKQQSVFTWRDSSQWYPKTMKWRPSWCTKPILWELSSFYVNAFVWSNNCAWLLVTWVKTLYCTVCLCYTVHRLWPTAGGRPLASQPWGNF